MLNAARSCVCVVDAVWATVLVISAPGATADGATPSSWLTTDRVRDGLGSEGGTTLAVAAEAAEESVALAALAADAGGELVSDDIAMAGCAGEDLPVAAAALLATGIGAALESLEPAEVVLGAAPWLSSSLMDFGGKPEDPELEERRLALDPASAPAPEPETESGAALAFAPLGFTVAAGLTTDATISEGPSSADSARLDPIGAPSSG
jgi:hypothetical protein